MPHHERQRPLNEPKGEPICICDPFSGTGTTFLETLKLGLNTRFVASDHNPMAGLLLKDNLHFFSLSQEELFHKSGELKTLLDDVNRQYVFTYPPNRPRTLTQMPVSTIDMCDPIIWAIETFMSECPDVGHKESVQSLRQLYAHDFTEEFINDFDTGQAYFWTRIIFYVVWRAVLTNLYKINAGLENAGNAIKREMHNFIEDLNTLAKMRTTRLLDRAGNIGIYEGGYSFACVVPETLLREEASELEKRHAVISGIEGDVLKVLANKEEFDLILTDPPYGFNTDYNHAAKLARLYIHALRQMIKALKKGGQLIFCLPAESFNGQSISYFSMKEIVLRDLLFAAQAEKRKVRYPGGAISDPVGLYKPPYYWRSEKALTRTVLHIRLD